MKKQHTVATALLAGLLLAGCWAGEDFADDSAPTPDESTSTTTTDAAPDAVDALQLTGPAEARTIPDMEVVVTDATPSLPATVTDATGKQITITSADRVLSLDLYGTLTDTIIGLGLTDQLVGRANSDTHPMLTDLPEVTKGGHDLNTEAVLALRPDLILTTVTIGGESNYRQFESAGVTVVRFEQSPSLDSIDTTIEQVGRVFGVEEAASELSASVNERLDDARAEIDALRAATPRNPRAAVLYVRGTAGIFFILGRDYGAADILDALGLADVAEENGINDLKPANAEALVALNPEIVLTMTEGLHSAGGVDGFLKRPGMSATVAGKNRRVVTAADTQLLAYGPRTPDSLLALARAIYMEPS